jgi:hypothetical protein
MKDTLKNVDMMMNNIKNQIDACRISLKAEESVSHKTTELTTLISRMEYEICMLLTIKNTLGKVSVNNSFSSCPRCGERISQNGDIILNGE